MKTRPPVFCDFQCRFFGLLLLATCLNPLFGWQLQQRFDKIPELAQSVVHCVVQDHTGFMWIGTRQGLFRYDGYELIQFRYQIDKPGALTSDWISALLVDRDGGLWVGTGGGGLNRFQGVSGFINFQHQPDNPNSLIHNQIHTLFEDDAGLWIGAETGLSLFNSNTGDFTNFNRQNSLAPPIKALLRDRSGRLLIGSDEGLLYLDGEILKHAPGDLGQIPIKTLYQQDNGVLWAGSDQGLYRYSEEGRTWSPFQHLPDIEGSLSHDRIRALAVDGMGRLWVGTFGGGLNRFNSKTNRFTTFMSEYGNAESLSDNRVYCLFTDASGVLWIGTNQGLDRMDSGRERFAHYHPGRKGVRAMEEGVDGFWVGGDDGLLHLDKDLNLVRHYRPKRDSLSSLSHSEVRALHVDSQDRLWVGTRGGLNAYIPERDHFRLFADSNRRLERVSVLTSDESGNLWVGTEDGGLCRFDGQSFEFFQHDPGDSSTLSHQEVTALLEDRAGVLWVGTWSGLNRRERSTNRFIRHHHEPGRLDRLSDDRILSIAEGRDGVLWVGTWRGLNRFDRETERVVRFGADSGLPGEMVMAILASDASVLWLSTNMGLSRFNVETQQFMNFDVFDGLQDNEFYSGSCLRDEQGRFFFGGVDGFNAFWPDRVSGDPTAPITVITRLEVFKNEAGPHNQFQGLMTHQLRSLELSYKENAISMDFSALHFASPEKNRYAYKMAGFDHNWVYTPERSVSYSHLNPGLYQFQVKGSNKDGVWSEEPASVRIHIRRPPWFSWQAISLYIVLFVGVALMYRRFHQKQLRYERTVNESLKALDRQKDEFLANTSHELRTPLHGIIGLAESLREGASGPLTPQLSEDLDMIIASGKRLSCLVDDILDFSKMVGDQLELHPENVDVRVAVDMVIKLTWPLMGNKQVALKNSIPKDLPPVEADLNRLHQILYNLLGNAVKFTDQGVIEIGARLDEGMVEVRVSDTGIGIPESELERIFRSFTQVDGSAQRIHGGAGLGLAITRQLVSLQGGKMAVSSVVGQGSVFSFTLPLAKKDVKMFRSRVEPEPESAPVPTPVEAPSVLLKDQHHQPHILIVDDEPINRQVLKNYLALEHYHLTEASGGPEALALLEAAAFDLILLDVMMPRMSGYQVCAEIRKNFSLRDLPVIFLTARNQEEDLVEGFQYGANDYLAKPIGKSELLSRVRTHLELRVLNRALEEKVAERTRDLKLANTSLQSQNLELEALNNIARTVNKEVALEQVVTVLLDHAIQLVDQAERGYFLLADSDGEPFRVAAMIGIEAPHVSASRIERILLEDDWLHQLEEANPGIRICSGSSCPKLFPSQLAPRAIMALTVPFRGHLLGILVLENEENPQAFPQSDVQKLTRFREYAVTAISKAKTFEALMEVQKELVDEAHQAGMAEIAATVLHNLGNTLNHIKTSIHGIEVGLRTEKTIKVLNRLARLLQDHHGHLPEFFQDQTRALQFQQALERISDQLNKKTGILSDEVSKISESLEEVVAVLYEQHRRARAKKPVEATDINRLLRDVVHRGDCLFDRDLMEVEEDFKPLPLIHIERPKLMHVLSYLLNNAREAIVEKRMKEKGRVCISTERIRDGILVTISDNGVGIDPDMLSKVFVHGFTTKKDHQGFGLHYCANTLKEMACTIDVASLGCNEGTRVSLFLPMRSEGS